MEWKKGPFFLKAEGSDEYHNITNDPLLTKLQTTVLGWCSCGSLESLKDPKQNTTTWFRDLESRVTRKQYADGSSYSYAYEPRGGRLVAVQDAKGQTKILHYQLDNRTSAIQYSGAQKIPQDRVD